MRKVWSVSLHYWNPLEAGQCFWSFLVLGWLSLPVSHFFVPSDVIAVSSSLFRLSLLCFSNVWAVSISCFSYVRAVRAALGSWASLHQFWMVNVTRLNWNRRSRTWSGSCGAMQRQLLTLLSLTGNSTHHGLYSQSVSVGLLIWDQVPPVHII